MKKGVCFVLLLFFLLSCAQKPVSFVSREHSFDLGVAPFTGKFSSDLLGSLDETLHKMLINRGWIGFKDRSVVRQCEEVVLSKYSNLKGLDKWYEVGKCVPVRFLLVPKLESWRERKGSRWGVVEPAMVEFYLFLIDVKEKKVLEVFHFKQEQKALSENLLQIKSFLKRKGWMTAKELFEEGLTKGLKELGLW